MTGSSTSVQISDNTIEVLLVEDNTADTRLVRETLAEAKGVLFRLQCADRLAAGMSRVAAGGIDVLLLDLGLPDRQGLATFKAVHTEYPSLPVVVLSGSADVDLAIEAVKAGAQDYLVKGTESCQLLTRALRYAIERKRAEEQIRRMATDLERRVSERTAELEAANRELEGFGQAVSHDLRTPLRAIRGFSEMLLEDYGPELPAEAQRRLRVIQDHAIQMGKLIDGLMVLAGVVRQPIGKTQIATGDLVRKALEELGPEQQGRQVTITVGELPACTADPVLLKQVFVNLLSNALKYTKKRPAAIIEVSARQEGGSCIYFVRDNGAGFENRCAGTLFEPFQRLHPEDEYEGIGIGLSIVQRIVQRHGGRIWAEGAVDQGAVFYFTLGG